VTLIPAAVGVQGREVRGYLREVCVINPHGVMATCGQFAHRFRGVTERGRDCYQSGLPARLERFLAARLPDASEVAVSECEPMHGGYSCRLTRFTARIDGCERQLVARADPEPGAGFLATDREREWAVVKSLTDTGSRMLPAALWYDADGSELGAKTFITEFVEGGTLGAAVQSCPPEDLPGHADRLCDLMTRIHAKDPDALPDAIERPGHWDDYFMASVETWRQAEAAHTESLPAVRFLASWLEEHRPPPAPLTLVHGEFQAPNVMIGPDGEYLAIDWEFARVADPREDMGWFKMVHAIQPPDLIGLDDAQFCARYRDRTGLGADIINPLTLAYFTILPGGRLLEPLLQGLRAIDAGIDTPVLTAYQIDIVATLLERWTATAWALEPRLRAGWEVAA
jgi:aminoglycoside phosphotransferase (APT) family kinase protein